MQGDLVTREVSVRLSVRPSGLVTYEIQNRNTANTNVGTNTIIQQTLRVKRLTSNHILSAQLYIISRGYKPQCTTVCWFPAYTSFFPWLF